MPTGVRSESSLAQRNTSPIGRPSSAAASKRRLSRSRPPSEKNASPPESSPRAAERKMSASSIDAESITAGSRRINDSGS